MSLIFELLGWNLLVKQLNRLHRKSANAYTAVLAFSRYRLCILSVRVFKQKLYWALALVKAPPFGYSAAPSRIDVPVFDHLRLDTSCEIVTVGKSFTVNLT